MPGHHSRQCHTYHSNTRPRRKESLLKAVQVPVAAHHKWPQSRWPTNQHHSWSTQELHQLRGLSIKPALYYQPPIHHRRQQSCQRVAHYPWLPCLTAPTHLAEMLEPTLTGCNPNTWCGTLKEFPTFPTLVQQVIESRKAPPVHVPCTTVCASHNPTSQPIATGRLQIEQISPTISALDHSKLQPR